MSNHIFYPDESTNQVLQQISSELRLSLLKIHSALERLAPPDIRDLEQETDLNAAVLCQSYYRILRLADNLADASEPERRANRGMQNEDVVEFCSKIAQRAQDPARMLGITLEFRANREHHFIVMDIQRMERLLLNLLSNAFKFMKDGEKKVTLSVQVNGEYVNISVSDTGRGIPPEKMATIFERFRQTRTLEPPPHGLGLGLPICKRIAEEHGGTLTPLSVAGEGTTITVSLPNRKVLPEAREPQIIFRPPAESFNRTLVELADALPKQAFTQKYLD